MRRSVRSALFLLLAVCLLTVTAFADMGPKSQLIVRVKNAPEGVYYLDLLAEGAPVDLHDYLSGEERAKLDPALLDSLIAQMAKGNKLNLIIYDGEWMYVHSNYANSLYVSENGSTAMFCTAAMQQGEWVPMPFTTLCAYQNGCCIRQGEPHGNEYILSEKDKQFLFSSMQLLE
jgi:glutamine amidotransferase